MKKKYKYKYIKIFIGILIFTFTFALIYGVTHKVYASTKSYYNSTPLGRGIKASNTANHNFSVVGMDILEKDYKDQLIKRLEKISYNRTKYEQSDLYRLKDYEEEVESSVKGGADFGLKFRKLDVKSALLVSNKFGLKYNKYNSSYFSIISAKIYKELLMLPNYLNYNEYRRHLSSNFRSELDRLFTYPSEAKFNRFFRTFGCHLLASGYYGGSLQAVNSFFSDTVNINGQYSYKIKRESNAALKNIKAGINYSVDFESIFSQDNVSVNNQFTYEKIGGNNSFSNSLSSIFKNYDNWKNSVEYNPELIEIPEDGTIPYWEILPNKWNYSRYRSDLKKNYQEYVKNNNSLSANSVVDRYNVQDGVIDLVYENVDYKRGSDWSDKHITDQYYYDNDYAKDKISLLENKINNNFLKAYGYNKITVKIRHEVMEFNDGWQCIAVFNYKDAIKNVDNKIVENDQQEHGSGYCNEKWEFHSCTIGSFDTDKLLGANYFYVRYRGRGYGEDDWLNRYVTITVSLSRGY